ncbi:hypothetical protein FACS189431_3630 [Alphaproteobacteria bacterium]|nr:hypothetical protein FACS189431_3630 [Alphaproteobacteria bacterium]
MDKKVNPCYNELMIMTAIILAILTVALTLLLGFRYRSNMSQFELKRRAEHSPEYKARLRFQAVYPGLRNLVRVFALVAAVAIVSVAFAEWQFVGTLIALGAIGLAFLLSHALVQIFGDLIGRHVVWFNKYFGWAEILGKISLEGGEVRLHSRPELAHIIERADFIDEADKNLLAGAVRLPEVKLADIMTRRSQIVFVNDQEVVGPKLIDELHSSGHRIFPVVSGDLDKIVGTLYLDDVVVVAGSNRALVDAMRPSPPVVSRGQSLLSVLNYLVKQNTTIAVVTDDKGATVGLVTLGDIVAVLSGNK